VLFSSGVAREEVQASAWVRVGDVYWTVDDEAYDMRDAQGQRALVDALMRRVYGGGK
jgi:hypothetical protein